MMSNSSSPECDDLYQPANDSRQQTVTWTWLSEVDATVEVRTVVGNVGIKPRTKQCMTDVLKIVYRQIVKPLLLGCRGLVIDLDATT